MVVGVELHWGVGLRIVIPGLAGSISRPSFCYQAWDVHDDLTKDSRFVGLQSLDFGLQLADVHACSDFSFVD
jgi:hypothetical protein